MNNLPPNVSNLDIEEQQGEGMSLPEVTPEMQAYADRITKEATERYEKALAEMTTERAIATIKAAAKTLGDNEYLNAEHQLGLIAEWLKRKEETKA